MLPQPLTVGTQVHTHGTHLNTSCNTAEHYEPEACRGLSPARLDAVRMLSSEQVLSAQTGFCAEWRS